MLDEWTKDITFYNKKFIYKYGNAVFAKNNDLCGGTIND